MAIDTAYCICSTQKTKSRASLSGKFKHNMRLHNPANADFSERSKNEVLIGEDGLRDIFQMSMEDAQAAAASHQFKSYNEQVKDTKDFVEKATGRKVRKDAVLAIEVVLTYTSAANEGIDLEAWKKQNVEWLESYFGRENIMSAVLHMDETCPHIHAMVSPIDRESGQPRYNAKKWLGGKEKMAHMQDDYSKAMSQFSLSRGEKRSKAKHEDLSEFSRALNKAVSRKPPQREQFKSDQEFQESIDEYYRQQSIKLFALEQRIRRLETVDRTREDNNRIYRDIAESRITGYEEQIKILTSSLSEAEKKARFVDNVNLALQKMKPDEAKELKDKFNDAAKKGGRLAAALARREQSQSAETDLAIGQ